MSNEVNLTTAQIELVKEARSKEAEAAWTNAYRLLAGVMIEGGNESYLHAA